VEPFDSLSETKGVLRRKNHTVTECDEEMFQLGVDGEKTFKLGLDWHGVLDAMIPEMAWLTRAIVAAGGEVHIMTGMVWTPECDEQLKSWGVHYTHTFFNS
jgi:hypothetical protein